MSSVVPLVPDLKRFTKQPSKNRKEIIITEESTALPCSSNNENSQGHTKLDGTSPKNIHIQETNNAPQRKYDKKFYCMFCNQPKSKLPKHLLIMHKDEEDVVQYAAEKNKDEKIKLYERMKNIRNHVHNCSVLESGEGELIVTYRPRKCTSLQDRKTMDPVLTVLHTFLNMNYGDITKSANFQHIKQEKGGIYQMQVPCFCRNQKEAANN
jgi:hypothetical protein